MRDKLYFMGFLLAAGLLLYLGRDLINGSVLLGWGLSFGGTATVAIMGLALYRFRLQLVASRLELMRQEAELNFALEVQQALFPRHFPEDGGLEFSAICIPARGVSGDYYDVMRLADGRIIFTIADISGKGISAAILMANFQAVLRTVVDISQSPSDICTRLNQHLHQVTDGSKFATCFLAEWNPEQRCLLYVNAGHHPPLLTGSHKGESLNLGGLPLGVLPEAHYETGRLCIEPGDMLILYSDGITDAGIRAEREFGAARLTALVSEHQGKPLAEIQARVIEAVRSWSGKEPEDDITLLLVRALDIK